MGSRGPIPKPAAQRRRRNRLPDTGVAPVLQLVGPSSWVVLPVPEGDWHPYAVEWWHDVQTSPATASWLPCDRALLERALRLCDAWWRAADVRDVNKVVRLNRALMREEKRLLLHR